MMKVLIVDDEPLARLRLRRLLEKVVDVTLVGEAGNGREALETMAEQEPDLVFLDIQMPDLTGMEVMEALDLDHAPFIIFVTAYDVYALEAFERSALDYLLKPFEDERFFQALERARQALADRQFRPFRQSLRQWMQGDKPTRPHQGPSIQRLSVQTREGTVFIPVQEIDWIGAEGVYVRIHSGRKNYLIRDSLTRLIEILPSEQFVRIHRSTLLNLKGVKALKSLPRGDGEVILADGTSLRLSRSFRASFQKMMGI